MKVSIVFAVFACFLKLDPIIIIIIIFIIFIREERRGVPHPPLQDPDPRGSGEGVAEGGDLPEMR